MHLTGRLTDIEKRALLKLSVILAMKDGELAESEVRPLRALAEEAGVALDEAFSDVLGAPIETICRDLSRPQASRVTVAELLRLAYRDEVYKEVERQTLRRVADALGLGGEALEALEEWVQRGLEWEREGRSLLLLEQDDEL